MFRGTIPNPCKDCKKRTLGCHSHCKDYTDWKVIYEKEKQEVIARKKLDDDSWSTPPNKQKRR